MAFVTKNRSGSWELRESRQTPAGPRSKTLATFKSLDHHHVLLAIERSESVLDEGTLVAAARKAGAPIALPPVEQAATKLLRAIGDGAALDPRLRELLLDVLSDGPNADVTNEVLGHIGKSAQERGAAVIDLLLLTDAIPRRESWSQLEFPGIPETSG
jgi:hypothetical protein